MGINQRDFRGPGAGKTAARARALQGKISGWLAGFGSILIREMMKEIDQSGEPQMIVKQDPKAFSAEQLAQIVSQFGLRQMSDAGSEALGERWVIPRTIEADFIREKGVAMRRLASDIAVQFREEVARHLAEWLEEIPQPSIGEIARRLRAIWFVSQPRPARLEGIPDAPSARNVGVRAELIARTEIGFARSEGRGKSIEAAGIPFKQWAAFTDGRSGDRHHERMDKVTVAANELFTLPSGIKVRWPNDAQAPIGETANCRCTLIPKRRK